MPLSHPAVDEGVVLKHFTAARPTPVTPADSIFQHSLMS